MRLLFGGRPFAAPVSALLLLHAVVAKAQPQTPPPPSQIQIKVMQGDNSTNDPGALARVAPAVRVEDGAGKAISSATVVFMLPTEGATGEFSNHSRTLTIVTDNDGYAVAKGLRTNQIQ